MRKKIFKTLVFLFALILFFIIAPKNLYAKTKLNLSSAKISLSATNFQYTGYQIKPTVTIKFNNMTVPASNYTVQYKNNIKPGTATVTVTAKSSSIAYTGSISTSFKINKRDISTCSIVLSKTSFVYNGEAQMPGVTVIYNTTSVNKTLVRGTD